MKKLSIACLVEGEGEVEAFPVLLRRIVRDIDPGITPTLRPYRYSAGSIRKIGGLENVINAIAKKYPNHSILVLADSDDDCPKQLAKSSYVRALAARSDVSISVVLANREYEAWFLASAESLAGKRNLKSELVAPPECETIRDAKTWLSKQMSRGKAYSPTADQAALSQLMDLDLVKTRSRSFRKLWKEVERMIDYAQL